MNHYELLLLINPRFTDEEAQAVAAQAGKKISEAGGTITREEHMGKRKLAYEIDHQKNGFYELMEFDIDPTKLADLETALRLEPDIIRHQVVRMIVRSPEALAAEHELQERIRIRRMNAPQAATEAKPIEEPVPPPVPQTEEERKASLEQLDEKLAELLKDDIIK